MKSDIVDTSYIISPYIVTKAYRDFFGGNKKFTPVQYIVFSVVAPFLLRNVVPGKALSYVINVDGEWYIGITNKWILSRTVFAGVDSLTSISTAMSGLCTMGLFHAYYQPSGEGCNYKYYRITDAGRSLIQPPEFSFVHMRCANEY